MLKSKLIKNAATFILVFSASLSAGCSSPLILKRSASENFLLSIKSNKSSVAYSVNSNLAEHGEINKGVISPFNKAFKSDIDDYIRTKFNNVIQLADANYVIDFELKDLDVDYTYNPDFGSAVLGGTNPILGRGLADVKVTVYVKIKHGDQVIGEKNIVSTTNYVKEVRSNEKYTHKRETYEEGISQALNKTIIIIDKYIYSMDI